MPSFKVNSRWARLSKLTDSLYIGGVVAVNPELISDNKITCIINCTTEVPNLRMSSVASMKLWVDDTVATDLSPYFDMVADQIQAIQDQEGRTLVHCLAGVSRSASFCMAYLMKYEHKTLREAFHHLAARRPVVRPNLAFWRQLIAYEQELRGATSVRMVRAEGTGQDLPDVYVVECSEEEEEEESSRDSFAGGSSADSISIASSTRSRSLSNGSTESGGIGGQMDLISEDTEAEELEALKAAAVTTNQGTIMEVY